MSSPKSNKRRRCMSAHIASGRAHDVEGYQRLDRVQRVGARCYAGPMRHLVALLGCLTVATHAAAQDAAAVQRLARDPTVSAALAAIEASEPATVAEQIRLCEIPAPPFKEAARAAAYADAFRAAGLKNVRVDGEGNVVGERP